MGDDSPCGHQEASLISFILAGIAVLSIVTGNDGIAAIACIVIMLVEMFKGD